MYGDQSGEFIVVEDAVGEMKWSYQKDANKL